MIVPRVPPPSVSVLRRCVSAAIAALLTGSLLVGAVSPVVARPRPAGPAPAPPSTPPGSPPARVVYAASGSQRTVALTFDDGWDAQRCLSIAATLDRYRIPATFFPNGVYVAQASEAWRSIGARFPLGNHTYHHIDLRTLDEDRIAKELERNRKLVEEVTGTRMTPFLRPPYGAWNARVARVAGRLGYTHIVLWSNTDADTAAHITPRGAAMAGLRADPGGIVLLHCGPEVTPEVLPIIIERYACDGFRFATVGELLAGSVGHQARVDCPPLALPAKKRPHRPTGSPEPSPSASAAPTTGPGLPPDPRSMLERVIDTLTDDLVAVIALVEGLRPPVSATPPPPPAAMASAPPSRTP